MKSGLVMLGAMIALVATPAAQAQVTVDVEKITCKQFLLDQVAPTKIIAVWLSGYYSGKRSNTVIDIGAMEKNADKVQDYCRLNLDTTVMDAVKNTLGVGK
jgi:acid stress chaperone HdeB